MCLRSSSCAVCYCKRLILRLCVWLLFFKFLFIFNEPDQVTRWWRIHAWAFLTPGAVLLCIFAASVCVLNCKPKLCACSGSCEQDFSRHRWHCFISLTISSKAIIEWPAETNVNINLQKWWKQCCSVDISQQKTVNETVPNLIMSTILVFVFLGGIFRTDSTLA